MGRRALESNGRGRSLISCLIRCSPKRSDPSGVNRNLSADCAGFWAQDFRHQLHFNIKGILIPAFKSQRLFLLGSSLPTPPVLWIISVGTATSQLLGSPSSATTTEHGPEPASTAGTQLTAKGVCTIKSQKFLSSSGKRIRGTRHAGEGSGRETALMPRAVLTVLNQGHELARRALHGYSTSQTTLFTKKK